MYVTIGERTVTLTDEQLQAFDNLTKLQQLTALGILSGMGQTEAYVAAGGKAKSASAKTTSAQQIVTNRDVVTFLSLMKTDPAPDIAAAVMSRDEMLMDLTEIARATIYDVAEFTTRPALDLETGEEIGQSTIRVRSLDEIAPEHRKLIKSVKQTKYGVEIVLHDSMQARKQIADLCGYDAPKRQEISGPEGKPVQVQEIPDEDIEQRLRDLGLGRYHNQLSGKVE